MNCLDLFAGGCNGFGLAAKWMGWHTLACVEIDKFCQKLLKQNFPESEIYGDIKEFNRTEAAKYRGRIDLITGGFPCQPFSTAGKREGTEDDRYLWPQMLETIRIIQPSFVIGENVAGLTTMDDGRTFDNILASLEDEGYTVESFILPACSVGAWHRRDRVFIVAHHESRVERTHQTRANQRQREKPREGIEPVISNGTVAGLQRPTRTGIEGHEHRPTEPDWWQAEPGVDRVVHGLPNRVDRIKALGNAVAPQVVHEIYKAIEATFLK